MNPTRLKHVKKIVDWKGLSLRPISKMIIKLYKHKLQRAFIL
jgi:hypothetical protein